MASGDSAEHCPLNPDYPRRYLPRHRLLLAPCSSPLNPVHRPGPKSAATPLHILPYPHLHRLLPPQSTIAPFHVWRVRFSPLTHLSTLSCARTRHTLRVQPPTSSHTHSKRIHIRAPTPRTAYRSPSTHSRTRVLPHRQTRSSKRRRAYLAHRCRTFFIQWRRPDLLLAESRGLRARCDGVEISAGQCAVEPAGTRIEVASQRPSWEWKWIQRVRRLVASAGEQVECV